MTITKVLTPFAFVALLALTAAPADAQQRRGDGGRSAGRSRGAVASRGGGYRGAQSRSYPVYRGGGGVRGGGFAVRGGGFRGRSSFNRPYYSFRPRVSLGFGLWMGYPVSYPYYYDSPYGYAYPATDPYAYESAPSYGYPAQPYGSPNQSSGYPSSNYPSSNYPSSNYPSQQPPAIGMQRGGEQSAPGGISFEITPDSAAVFVDGTYMGTAGDFGSSAEPLGLNVGRHHVEVRASGYRTMTFEADVRAGQVIPYQGTLQRN